jgi:hypothetical protein
MPLVVFEASKFNPRPSPTISKRDSIANTTTLRIMFNLRTSFAAALALSWVTAAQTLVVNLTGNSSLAVYDT